MLLASERAPQGSDVPDRGHFPAPAGSPWRQADDISNDSSHPYNPGGSLMLPHSRWTWWATLDADDRKVFKRWAIRVTAFYSLLIVSLLGAMLLGVHNANDPNAVRPVFKTERSLTALPVPPPGGGRQ